MRTARMCVCLPAILAILALGKAGEEALGFALVMLDKAAFAPETLNAATAFVVRNYRLNQNHFLLSLTPFLLAVAAMPFLDRAVAQWDAKFWYAFAGVWLLLIAYCAAFAYALMVPFTHVGLAADHEATLVTYAALAACALIAAVLTALRLRAPKARPSERD